MMHLINSTNPLRRITLALCAALAAVNAVAVTKVADFNTLVPGSTTRKFTRFEQTVATGRSVAFLSVESNLAKLYLRDLDGLRALNTQTKTLGHFTCLAVDGDTLYAAGAAGAYADSGLYRLDGATLTALDASIGDLPVPASATPVNIDRMAARGGRVAVVVSRYLAPPAPRSYLGIFVFADGAWTKVMDNQSALPGTDKVIARIDSVDMSAAGHVLFGASSDQGGTEIFTWDGTAVSVAAARGIEVAGKQFYPSDYGNVAFLADGTTVFHGLQFRGDNGLAGIGATAFFLPAAASPTSFFPNGDRIAVNGYLGTFPDGANAIFNLLPDGTAEKLIDSLTDIGGGVTLPSFSVSRDGVNGANWAAVVSSFTPSYTQAIFTNVAFSPPLTGIAADFPGAVAHPDDIYAVQPLAWVYAPAAAYPWIYSFVMNEWCYLAGNAASLYFYLPSSGWHYTNNVLWPWTYGFQAADWTRR